METEGPGSDLPNGEIRMEPTAALYKHGGNPSVASTPGQARISNYPMCIAEDDSVTINGVATTGPVLLKVLEGSFSQGSPAWMTDLAKNRREMALQDNGEIWAAGIVAGDVVQSIELFADELVVALEIVERNDQEGFVLLECRYAYASLRTMDKLAPDWEQAFKVRFLLLRVRCRSNSFSFRFRRLSIRDPDLYTPGYPFLPLQYYHYHTFSLQYLFRDRPPRRTQSD